ncbi:alanine racemase [candidate division WOR-1 bacterium RIFOXYA12_FULL_52_29]|uniref:Alanine racemase n=1 Tax=candidate division WOR-1 bacterium RIFOXYC12_FULL_54_18 TaxID=1802584 RepID=A0A1F4T564_UNCSA|nr:MAG: alanine racemase [candidate division WOR-1 bacterium RIFOXYA2_FULL_51_19]OGC17534.1 MAG: alanine racemase [candidate division WOR-1 bacterium RIFOXYA12_FULL_52_29]OGC26391.1 MAG: alanine racemase [candidate division WOR-1 bacterium RIFOXYB2_FULL_45_9]OGC27951.1 MAG: alanine racemase [candidate division WOR-1 bacterium RIFOXYC12_FULL_54_18]OGC29762.1 MAG: alanine racemase [candidate division WOR-1 bacterium RIFOXYB12_FULL_52_16]
MNTHAEINLAAIKNNIGEIRKKLSPAVKFMAVVKANAYGHGAVAVARAAGEAGADYLGVANLKEALELREAGILSPILILTESPTSVADEIIQHDLTQTIYSFAEAKALSEEAQKRKCRVKVHVKIDTGMGRVGVAPSEAIAFIAKVSSLPGLTIEGLFTHFAKAEDPEDKFTEEQFSRFKQLADRAPNIPIKHSANSAAALFHPSTHLDMVRIGLMMYGLYPLGNSRRLIALEPALSFKTRVVYLKRVPAGTPLSYGSTYLTREATNIATLPVGYADGFSRRLSNRGHVLIRGKRFPIVGRVSMDMSLVNVGSANVEVGDEAVLIGRQGGEGLSADEMANLEETISYEVVCSIGKRVPRVYK